MVKRVLIFSLTYLPFVGGAEIAIKEITDRIDSHDIEFDMITLCFDATLPRVEKIGNITVHRIGFGARKPTMSDLVKMPLALNKYLFPVLGWLKARQLQRDHAYDALWAMMANYAAFAALFFKLQHPKIPFLLTLQEGDPIDYIKHRVRFVYPLFKKIFTKADFVQTISHYLAAFAHDMGFTGPLEVVPNAVDVKYFSQTFADAELDILKQKLDEDAATRFLITVSRLVPKNAVNDVIAALSQLPANIHFLVLGVGPDEQKLKEQSQKLAVANRVHFLGHIEHIDLPKYLNIADIFIRPSLSEGMGNAFVEAMAARIPVIATPVGGIVDFLFDPEANPEHPATGLFVKVHDPDDIARQVQRLLSDTTLADQLVDNAFVLVREHYDWDLIARAMREKVFTKLLV